MMLMMVEKITNTPVALKRTCLHIGSLCSSVTQSCSEYKGEDENNQKEPKQGPVPHGTVATLPRFLLTEMAWTQNHSALPPGSVPYSPSLHLLLVQ